MNMKLDKVKIIDKKGNKLNLSVKFDYEVKDKEIVFKDNIEFVMTDEEGKEVDRYGRGNYMKIWNKYVKFEQVS